MIDPREISVVVQGPIVGKPTDPYEERLTERCLDSIRAHLPGAETVVSTWRGAEAGGLRFDRLVESVDPGAIPYDEGMQPRVYYNANRQIACTRAGLLAASRPYAVKIRSDMVLTGNGFLRYFQRFRARNAEWRILRDRVVTGTVFSRNPRRRFHYPFHPSDWFHFGWRDDVLNIWDIPLAAEPEIPRWFDTRPSPPGDVESYLRYRYTVEQYIWLSFLRKHGAVEFDHKMDLSNGSIDLSELTIANNLVLADSSDLGIKFLKYPISVEDGATMYTHGDWLRMYQKHCDPATEVPLDLMVWRKQGALVASRVFNTLHAARHSEPMNRVRHAWERRSPGSLRAAKKLFQLAFDAPREWATHDPSSVRRSSHQAPKLVGHPDDGTEPRSAE